MVFYGRKPWTAAEDALLEAQHRRALRRNPGLAPFSFRLDIRTKLPFDIYTPCPLTHVRIYQDGHDTAAAITDDGKEVASRRPDQDSFFGWTTASTISQRRGSPCRSVAFR
jgi:hypothetical protein